MSVTKISFLVPLTRASERSEKMGGGGTSSNVVDIICLSMVRIGIGLTTSIVIGPSQALSIACLNERFYCLELA